MNSNSSLFKTILVICAAMGGANAAVAARIAARLRRFLRDGYGTTALEYALIAAITAMVAVVGMVSIGGGANASLHLISNAVEPAMTPINTSPSGNPAPSPNAAPGPACTSNCGSMTTTVP